MTEPSRHTGWRPRIGAAIACFLLAGCSTASTISGGADSTLPTVATTTTTSPAPTTTPGAALPASEPVDAAALLAAALSAYEAGYEFNSLAVVNGAPAVVVEGRTVAGVSEMKVSSGTATVEYLTAGAQQWTRVEEGEWDLIAEDGTGGSPLAALATPAGLAPLAIDGDTVVVLATYPAAALSLTGDTVDVRLTLIGGLLMEAAYEIDEPAPAQVTTTFRPLADATPITLPPA